MGGEAGKSFLFTRITSVSINLRTLIGLFLDPLLEGSALTRYLERVKYLPLMGLVKTMATLNGFTYHSKEEGDDGTVVLGYEPIPSVGGKKAHLLLRGFLFGNGNGCPRKLRTHGFVELVKQVDEVFMAVIRYRNTEHFIRRSCHRLVNLCEKPNGAHVGRMMSGPQGTKNVLIGEKHTTVRTFRR